MWFGIHQVGAQFLDHAYFQYFCQYPGFFAQSNRTFHQKYF
jgi:hypothetical protein